MARPWRGGGLRAGTHEGCGGPLATGPRCKRSEGERRGEATPRVAWLLVVVSATGRSVQRCRRGFVGRTCQRFCRVRLPAAEEWKRGVEAEG